MVIRLQPTPGSLRLWRPAERDLHAWAVPVDDLADAVYLAGYIATNGWPTPCRMAVQRYEDGAGWVDVPAAELAAVAHEP